MTEARGIARGSRTPAPLRLLGHSGLDNSPRGAVLSRTRATLGRRGSTGAATHPDREPEIAVNRPLRLLACAYIVSVPFDIFQIAGGRTAQLPIAVLLLVTWFLSGPKHFPYAKIPLTLLYLLCAWTLATIFWSVDPKTSILASVSLCLQASVFVVLCDVLPHIFERSMVWLTLATTALAAIVFAQPSQANRAGRANVSGVDENITALVLAVGFAVALHLVFTRKGLYAWIWLACSALIAAATVHTGSRTGVVALVATLAIQALVLPYTSERKDKLFRAFVVAVVGGWTFSALAASSGGAAERVIEVFNQRGAVDDSGRGYILSLYLQWIDEWFFTGVGYGADASFLDLRTAEFFHAHNLLWKTWVELGLLGVLVVGALLAACAWNAWRSGERAGIAVIAAPLLPFAYTLGGFQVSAFWLVMAWAVSSTHVPTALTREPNETA